MKTKLFKPNHIYTGHHRPKPYILEYRYTAEYKGNTIEIIKETGPSKDTKIKVNGITKDIKSFTWKIKEVITLAESNIEELIR